MAGAVAGASWTDCAIGRRARRRECDYQKDERRAGPEGVEQAHEDLTRRILSRCRTNGAIPPIFVVTSGGTGLPSPETYFTTRVSTAGRSGPCLVSHALS